MLTNINKKVLLRDCKKHTTCQVANTRSAVLSWEAGGYTSPSWGVLQSCPGWGVHLTWGIPPKLGLGYPLARTGAPPPPPSQDWGTSPAGKGLGPETCEWTESCEKITFPILRMRSVKTHFTQ